VQLGKNIAQISALDIKVINLPPVKKWYGKTRKLRVAFVLSAGDAGETKKERIWTEFSSKPAWYEQKTMYGAQSYPVIFDFERWSSVLRALLPC